MADDKAPAANAAGEPSLRATLHRILKASNALSHELGTRPAFLDDSLVDMSSVAKSFAAFAARQMSQPRRWMLAPLALTRAATRLSTGTLKAALGREPLDVAQPHAGDRRFRDPAWNDNLYFNIIKQCYLLMARWVMAQSSDVQGLRPHQRRQVDFYLRQYVDALAPTNFAPTNPSVIRAALDTGGRNLLEGLANMLEDLARGRGRLHVRMTDQDAFQVGENVANTPGKVVYQNELMQLIQYSPTTEQVHQRPLLVIPPWINKYYILDLGEEKSFVRFWVDNGFTVFMISWVNPDEDLACKSFDDYMLEGPLEAMDAIERATGERELNVIGYCIGGTLLSATLAYMAAQDDRRVRSATFFVSLIDFTDVGDISAFIDEEMLESIDDAMNRTGYLDGSQMATAFNMLRSNDLIWSFFVNNYLLGKKPPTFDLLYWNSDSTRMPAAMHSFYLRNMYLENRLREPGGIELAGVPIDVRTIKVPSYFASAVEDHIAPWTSVYRGARLLGGPARFVLGKSGHIAGIVNPPSADKYGYWTHRGRPQDPQAWLENASYQEGSWWMDWLRWISRHAGPKVAAREPGGGGLKVIEDAPGSYVKKRTV